MSKLISVNLHCKSLRYRIIQPRSTLFGSTKIKFPQKSANRETQWCLPTEEYNINNIALSLQMRKFQNIKKKPSAGNWTFFHLTALIRNDFVIRVATTLPDVPGVA